MTTVAADASVRPDGATWAAVVLLPGGNVVRLRGRLSVCRDSCHAEFLAIHRALSATPRGEPVEIVLDNNRVVAWLRGTPPPARLAGVVGTIRSMLRARGGHVRWTPAHRGGEDAMHREADRLASVPSRTITSLETRMPIRVYGTSPISRSAA